MNYIFLKNIIDTMISHFACQSCGKQIDEQSISVTGITDHGLSMTVICPHCQTQAMLKAEVNAFAHELLKTDQGKSFFRDFMKSGGTIGATLAQPRSTEAFTIKDEDISHIAAALESKNSVEDFLR